MAKRGNPGKLTPELAEEVRKRWLGGESYVQIRAWLSETHGLVVSDACLSRSCQKAGREAGEVLYRSETEVRIVEVESGPEVDDDAVCALYRNELLKEMQAAKKERKDGAISAQEWRGTLIQLARASNDVVKTRKLLRAPDKAPQGYAPGGVAPEQATEVIFGNAQA